MRRVLPSLMILLCSASMAVAATAGATTKGTDLTGASGALVAKDIAAGAKANAGATGAKGMFYEQLAKPTEPINNGLQYWIELKRVGEPKRLVSNKFEFKTGDQIRLHVRSNVDGFAYIVLREGSKGEHAVLFPDVRHQDDNHLKANTEYVIPNDSWLAFDQNPGSERVTFVLSRKPIEEKSNGLPNKYKDTVVVASRIEGSKDLIPGSLVVSYGNEAHPIPSAAATEAAVASLPVTPVAPVNDAQPPKPADSPVEVIPPAQNDEAENAIITVVQKDPAAALALEICLEHRP